MYDEVKVPCPRCGTITIAQSKGGACELNRYALDNAPLDVLSNVNRHAPFRCRECGELFAVKLTTTAQVVVVEPSTSED